MSLDDNTALFKNSTIQNARAHVAHGKHFELRQLASRITSLRQELLREHGTLEAGLDALMLNVHAEEGLLARAGHFGTRLLQFVLIDPKLLRALAQEFRKLQDKGAVDPRAENIITAYKHCVAFPPSFTEVKHVFIGRFGESRWRGDFAVRKTLRSLDLPLSKSKRGRPKGSKSKSR